MSLDTLSLQGYRTCAALGLTLSDRNLAPHRDSANGMDRLLPRPSKPLWAGDKWIAVDGTQHDILTSDRCRHR